MCNKGIAARLFLAAVNALGVLPSYGDPMEWTVDPTPVLHPPDNDVGVGFSVYCGDGLYRAVHDDGRGGYVNVMTTSSLDGYSWDPSVVAYSPTETNDANTEMVVKDGVCYLWVGGGHVEMATSPDGFAWTHQGRIAPDDWGAYAVLSTPDGFEAWYKRSGDTCYGYGTSVDGLNWIHHGCVMQPGSSGEFDAQLGYLDVVRIEGAYHMWYVAVTADDANLCLAYATSADGILWEKHGCVTGFETFSCDTWYALSVCHDGGRIRMWALCYLEHSVYHAETPFVDCNHNGFHDEQDISRGTSEDCQPNGIPDECDLAQSDNVPAGDLLVSSSASLSIKHVGGPLSATPGEVLGDLVVSDPSGPYFMTFGPDGHGLYFGAANTHKVLRYDLQTAVLSDFVTSTNNLPDAPKGLTFGLDGHLYVTETGSHGYGVLRYHGETGAPLPGPGYPGCTPTVDAPWFICPNADIVPAHPNDLVFREDGFLYVSGGPDYDVGVIARFDATTGEYVDDFCFPYGPDGFTFGPDGNLYSMAFFADVVERFDGVTGEPLPSERCLSVPEGRAFFVCPEDNCGLLEPRGKPAFGPEGQLYVSNPPANSVMVFDGDTGECRGVFATVGGPRSLLFVEPRSDDCDGNGVPDSCDIATELHLDSNGNGALDLCECISVHPPELITEGKTKSRYISFTPGNAHADTALRVTLTDLDGYPEDNGRTLWVGPPRPYPEEDLSDPTRTFTAARLACEPYFMDWGTIDELHVFGGEIVPGSSYAVHAVHASCAAALDEEPDFGIPLEPWTGTWGDVVPPFADDPGAPPQPDFNDIAAVVEKFLATPTAPAKAFAQLQPNVVLPSRAVDFRDIAIDVQAFLGVPYASLNGITGPCVCPSNVTCGATPCSSDLACGDGYCIDGFCTDVCGRCSP